MVGCWCGLPSGWQPPVDEAIGELGIGQVSPLCPGCLLFLATIGASEGSERPNTDLHLSRCERSWKSRPARISGCGTTPDVLSAEATRDSWISVFFSLHPSTYHNVDTSIHRYLMRTLRTLGVCPGRPYTMYPRDRNGSAGMRFGEAFRDPVVCVTKGKEKLFII